MNKGFRQILIGLAALLSLSFISGCNKNNSGGNAEPAPGDKNWVDYANDGTVKLGLDYKGKDFYKDGIGEVTLKTVIDGDTAHFNPVVTQTSSLTIKSRYYGIDTPESTGRVQEYGKAASNFNKERLTIAASYGTIVVSSAQDNYGTPNPDSTGERYVSLIWINESKQHANFDELYLLNLAIVEYGYSWVKNVQDMPQYSETFYKAETQAKNYKLNLFSGKPDPLFNYGEYEETSLLDLKIATENYIKDKNYESPLNGAKVRIRGTVAGFSNGTMYLQSYFTEEASEEVRGEGKGVKGGEYASINIFCGMSAVPSKYKKINTYIELCCIAQHTENFGFQLTGAEGHFPIVASEANDDDCHILLTADENQDDQKLHIAEYTAQQLDTLTKSASSECLNCAVRVTDPVKCSKFYINDKQDEITLSFEGVSFKAYITSLYAGDPSKPTDFWKTEDKFVGQKFMLEGIYSYHKTQSGNITYQMIFDASSSINQVGLVWVQE